MRNKGSVFIIAAAFLWGIITIFIKRLSAAGLSPLQIALVRLLFATPIFAAVTAIKDPALFKIDIKDIWMFAGTGIISIVLFNVCYFYTIVNGQASVAVVLLYTAPIFVMLMSAMIFKEKITSKKIIALILTTAGCIFVSGILQGKGEIKALVFASGILSGFLYALYTVFGSFAIKKYNPVTVTLYTFIMGLAGLLPVSGIKSVVEAIITKPELLVWSASLALLCTVLPYLFYNIGLKTVEPGSAAVLATVEPIVGCITGIALFNEKAGALKIMGMLLIVSATVLLNINNVSRETSPKTNEDNKQ